VTSLSGNIKFKIFCKVKSFGKEGEKVNPQTYFHPSRIIDVNELIEKERF